MAANKANKRRTMTLIPRKGGRKEKPAPAHSTPSKPLTEARTDDKAG